MSNPVSVDAPVAAAPAAPAPNSPTPAGDLSGKAFVAKKPAVGSSREDLLAKVNATFKAEMAAMEAPAPVPPSADSSEPVAGDTGVTGETSVETTDKVADAAPAADGEKVPAKAPGESERGYAHRIAQAQLATAKAEEKALAAEERAKASEAKFAEAQSKLDEAAKDAHKALALAGYDPLSFAEAMRDGKLTAAERKEIAALDPELAAMLAEHKAFKAKAESDAKKAEAEQVYTTNLKLVSDTINAPEFVTDFPAVVAIGGAATMLQIIESDMAQNGGKEPDFRDVAKRYNDALVSDTSKLLAHGPTVERLLKDNPELKAQLVKALGLDAKAETAPAAKAAPAKPATVTNKIVAKVPSRSGKALDTASLVARIQQVVDASKQ